MSTLNEAIGLIVLRALLLGVIYGSSGEIIKEFARTTLGGNANVLHNELSTKAVARVVRRVVIAVGISPPLSEGLARVRSIL